MRFSMLSQVQLVLLALFVMSVQSELCERLHLGGLDEKFVTYIQLGGKSCKTSSALSRKNKGERSPCL